MKPVFTYVFIQIVQGIHNVISEKVVFQDLNIGTVSL